jgi:uncharacterized protein YndB with AHSA1/START domain
MTTPETATLRSVIIEKDLPYPPEKVWQALTEGPLIEQWLMKNDFQPVLGQSFRLRADPVPNWDGIIECQVLSVEPFSSLSYTWRTMGHESTVIFTLTATGAGTHLRMEHAGFRPDQEAAYKGAQYGWKNFINRLEGVIAAQ